MRSTLLLSSLAVLGLTGCGASGYGVTQGGVQDMNHARELIEDGLIPGSDDYTVEGLFSEHALPISGETCDETLCPRAATARVQTVDGAPGRLLLQLGFATDLNEDNFERPPLNLAVAIDISGSMSGEKLKMSKEALLEVVDQLDKGDHMALITYGSRAKVVRKLIQMDKKGRDKMRSEINSLSSHGSTAMEEGLLEAMKQLEGRAGKPGAEDRIFLLTDAQPNVGATGAGSFVRHLRNAADDEIGVTVWGVGMDLGSELVTQMSNVRGGNAFHFTEVEKMQKRVRSEFDQWVTPLAYDVEIYAAADRELRIDQTWGAPLDGDDVKFGASTLFLSKRDGGMGVTLLGSDGAAIVPGQEPPSLAALEVSWLPVDSDTREQAILDVEYKGGTTFSDDYAQADDLGVFKMGALIDEIIALDSAAAFCTGDLDSQTAEALIADTADRLESRATLIDEDDFETESELMKKLLANVRGGIGNCMQTAAATDE